MSLWVPVDVYSELAKVCLRIHLYASKPLLEQPPCAPMPIVECLGICVEEVRERLVGIGHSELIGHRRSPWLRSDLDHDVEVIPHQTIRKRISHPMNVLDVESEEFAIVRFIPKEILAIVAAVVEVIRLSWLDWNGHLYFQILRWSLTNAWPTGHQPCRRAPEDQTGPRSVAPTCKVDCAPISPDSSARPAAGRPAGCRARRAGRARPTPADHPTRGASPARARAGWPPRPSARCRAP